MKLYFPLFLMFFCCTVTTFADKPEWIDKLPFTDDAFWGVGSAPSLEEAQIAAKKEILMQLCSQVKAVVNMEENSNGGDYQINEDLDVYFNSNSLRGAAIEDKYEDNGTVWVLMKYCDECGKMLMNSALTRYENKYKLKPEKLMQELASSNIPEVLEIGQRLKELNLDDYRSDDINVSLSGKTMKIMIINFLPYETTLSASQEKGLSLLSSTLFKELKALKYDSLSIIGHANPTGEENEETDLVQLSKNRAETLAEVMKKSGFQVDSVSWKGGTEPIGDTSTPEGMGMNRRVEVDIQFEE